jgi:predicted metal-dependent hydrolase
VSTDSLTIVVSGIPVQVVRKDIKNLHVGVYPPTGRVRVAAPVRLSDETVRLAVVTRLGWIRRQQKGFQRQERQPAREMVSGESHYVQGRRYRLEITEAEGERGVRLRANRRLELRVRPGASREQRERMLNDWYRGLLRDRLPGLISQWEACVGVEVAEWGIRKMKTRWGTCNQAARRIWINLELAKKPVSCLEFIVVHELVHILERHHNDRFRAHMDQLLPHWTATRDQLNRAPLGQESWEY